VYYIYY